jgi:uncharacterized protein DUF742
VTSGHDRGGEELNRLQQPFVPAEEEPEEELPSIVRAYAWTGGRVRTHQQLEIETLVSATALADAQAAELSSEHESVAKLCRRSVSVAEISALLSLPLSVVRVLLDDMARLGLVDIHHNETSFDDRPDMELLERVRRGLSNLQV